VGDFLEVEVRPPWPYRMPRGGRGDGVMRIHAGAVVRLLHIDGEPVIVRVCQRRGGEVCFRAGGGNAEQRERAIERMRFATAVDDDLSAFHREFKDDPFLGPAIRHRPWIRVKRRPFAWEALAWAVTEQLIESSHAAQIQRAMVRRWGRKCERWSGPGPLRDVPTAADVAERSQPELQACDLSAARSLALIRCAQEVVAGRVDPADPQDDVRLLKIREIGPWTLQCLGSFGRGDADSLPAGDLAYVKFVGVAANLGRRAMVDEVEDFYARYAPFRALAGLFSLSHYGARFGAAARGLPHAPDALAA
jgi:3-methyladenine DNA glycosylase/8-oxoguanine DNA glycosylase